MVTGCQRNIGQPPIPTRCSHSVAFPLPTPVHSSAFLDLLGSTWIYLGHSDSLESEVRNEPRLSFSTCLELAHQDPISSSFGGPFSSTYEDSEFSRPILHKNQQGNASVGGDLMQHQ